MPIQQKLENDNTLVFHFGGQLSQVQYKQFQEQIEALGKEHGKIKLLVILEDFQGWEAGDGWADTTDMTDRIDPYLKKMAVVGEEKWQDKIEVFTLKGLRPVPIEYYVNDEQAARQWLNSD
jgi:hypothetical protein